MYIRSKKSLGQHFLKDTNIAKKIVDSIDGEPLLLIEIGPGMGILTKFLVEKYQNVYAIEIDKEAVEYLIFNSILHEDKIIRGNILELDIKKAFKQKMTIIGNFPYNISSQIFFKILENKDIVDQTVCMIQKEVAERISAHAGTKTYGILSVLLQTFYDINYLFTVNEHVFVPPPKVKSAVIRLKRNTTDHLECNEEIYFKIIKTAFNQRRKTLRNSLKAILPINMSDLEILNKRPEQLDVNEFVYLAKLIENKQV